MSPLQYIAKQIQGVDLETVDVFDKYPLLSCKLAIGASIKIQRTDFLKPSVEQCPPKILAAILDGADYKIDAGLLFASHPKTKMRLDPEIINWMDDTCILSSGEVVINPVVGTDTPIENRLALLARFVELNPDLFPVQGDTVHPKLNQSDLYIAVIKSGIIDTVVAADMFGNFKAWARAMSRDSELGWSTLKSAAGATKVRWRQGFADKVKAPKQV